MDICYILGTGSKHDNKELRFSLRGIEKCLTFDRVFIIGSDPGFLSDEVIYVPNHPEQRPDNKAWAIKEQLLKVCGTDISDDFISLNDDYFFLKPITDFPYFYKGDLTESLEVYVTGDYYRHILATEQWLLKQKLPVKHFDGHWPMIYNKHKLKGVIAGFDWKSVPYCPEMRSLYCNTLGIVGEYRQDVKALKKENWETFCVNKEMFSVNDEAIDRKFLDFCLVLWPNKSRFEK